jgi:hypothetical protein
MCIHSLHSVPQDSAKRVVGFSPTSRQRYPSSMSKYLKQASQAFPLSIYLLCITNEAKRKSPFPPRILRTFALALSRLFPCGLATVRVLSLLAMGFRNGDGAVMTVVVLVLFTISSRAFFLYLSRGVLPISFSFIPRPGVYAASGTACAPCPSSNPRRVLTSRAFL